MKRKKQRNQEQGGSGFTHLSSKADFYSGERSQKPLFDDRPKKDPLNSRKTLRHQQVAGREKVKMDPREKAALFGILKAAVTLFFLVILFFMLWKGINLYEESVWLESQSEPELSPVLQQVDAIDDFDISADDAKEAFSDRIRTWDETDRIIRSVENLLLRENIADAIERCQEALRLNPFHIESLELLGELYFKEEMYVEAVNTYIRLLSVDPSSSDYQLELLRSLDAYGDSEATIEVARWYQGRNLYNESVQRYIARAHYMLEEFEDAAAAYERVLKDTPKDVVALENQAVSYMQLEQYADALATLEKLVAIEFRDPVCHKRIAVCNAQLGKGEETVQVLGKSAHLFGADTVVMWIQDPMLDPVRLQRPFQIYADSLITEEYRQYLEEMARAAQRKPRQEIGPRLEVPDYDRIDTDLLKPRQ